MMTAIQRLVAWLLVFVLLLVLFAWAVMTMAHAAASCLTKEQARAKWPKEHLYWHTSERCWDEKPGRGRTYGKREPEKEKPKPEDLKPIPAPPPRADASGNNLSIIYVKENEFNELDAQASEPPKFYPTLMPSANPPAALMLSPIASTQWQSITDPDVMIMFMPWELRAGGAFAR